MRFNYNNDVRNLTKNSSNSMQETVFMCGQISNDIIREQD